MLSPGMVLMRSRNSARFCARLPVAIAAIAQSLMKKGGCVESAPIVPPVSALSILVLLSPPHPLLVPACVPVCVPDSLLAQGSLPNSVGHGHGHGHEWARVV